MLELLRDPIWQFAGAILAVVAIAISVAVYFAQRQRKDFSFEVVSNTPLLTLREENLGQLQLLYNGAPVTNPRLIVIRVTNTGNMPISKMDYERPVSFRFGAGCLVLSTAVTQTTPENLGLSVEARDDALVLQPTLLNPRDSATLKVLVSGEEHQPTADGRIHGVRSVHPVVERAWLDGMLATVGILLFIGAMIAAPKAESKPLVVTRDEIPALVAALAGALFFGAAYIRLVLRVVRRPSFRRRMMRVFSRDLV